MLPKSQPTTISWLSFLLNLRCEVPCVGKGKRKGKKKASLVVDNQMCISEIDTTKGKSCDLPYIFCTLLGTLSPDFPQTEALMRGE